MATNQAILLPPDTVHLCQPHDLNKFNFKMIYIDPLWFLTEFNMDSASMTPLTAQLDTISIKLKDHFFSSFENFQDPFKAESDTIFFLGHLLFDTFKIKVVKPPPIKKMRSISKIKMYIDKHFTHQIQLNDLAKIIGESKFSMLRNFNTTYKLTPHAYILNKRINHAKRLLLESQTVAQTAVDCGFFDQSHFIKTFQKFVGVNPMDYK